MAVERVRRNSSGVLSYATGPLPFWIRHRVLILSCCALVALLAAAALTPKVWSQWQRFRWASIWASCAAVHYEEGAVVLEEGEWTTMPTTAGNGLCLRRRDTSVGIMAPTPRQVERMWDAAGANSRATNYPVIFV